MSKLYRIYFPMMWIHDFAEFIQKRKVWGLVLKFADRLIYVKNPVYFLEWRMFYSMTISWKELCKKSNNFNIVFKTYSDFYFAWLIITEYHFIFPRCQVTSNSWKANLLLFFSKKTHFSSIHYSCHITHLWNTPLSAKFFFYNFLCGFS